MQRETILPPGLRRLVWLAFMIAASVALSLGFACAVPLAAFAAMLGLTMDRRSAVLMTGAVWLANQAVGYTCLGYPTTANSIAWGAVLGLAAIAAMLAARWSGMRFARLPRAATLAVAFAAAFAAYEATLFAAALTLLGGTEDFTVAIVGRVLEINAISMLGMLLLNGAGAQINNLKDQGVPSSRSRQRA